MWPLLRTGGALLRLPLPADAPMMLDYFSAEGHRYDPPPPPELLNLEHWRRHADTLRKGFEAGSSCRFFVFTPDQSQIIGTVDLVRIERGVRFDCTLGYAIAAAYEGRSVAYECVRKAIGYAFDELNLHRIEATHALDNQRSQKLLVRLGFSSVGTIPEFNRSGDAWCDSHLMTLLNPRWQAPA